MKPNPLRDEITSMMHIHRVYVTDIAKKIDKHRVTVHVWLRDIDDERHQTILNAVKEIIEERGQ